MVCSRIHSYHPISKFTNSRLWYCYRCCAVGCSDFRDSQSMRWMCLANYHTGPCSSWWYCPYNPSMSSNCLSNCRKSQNRWCAYSPCNPYSTCLCQFCFHTCHDVRWLCYPCSLWKSSMCRWCFRNCLCGSLSYCRDSPSMRWRYQSCSQTCHDELSSGSPYSPSSCSTYLHYNSVHLL